jgi:glycosyltransferase involved in cell wall biosynthesis
MWRSENQRIAAFLATEVLPRVRSQVGSARLRLVGALPPPEITRLESIEGVEVVGRVPSIEEEYFASGLAFCPSMVEAGILLKALIAMACGVPTVLNNNSALSFEGLVHGRQALVADDALAMASAAVSVLTSADRGASLGRSAREYVAARYTWESCAESMTTVFRNTQSGES